MNKYTIEEKDAFMVKIQKKFNRLPPSVLADFTLSLIEEFILLEDLATIKEFCENSGYFASEDFIGEK